MYSNDRHSIRQFFLTCRKKQRDGEALEPLEHLVAGVIAAHPEYHHLLDNGEHRLDEDYSETPQDNPFLHMGMHISIGEQLSADRPAGIRAIYQRLQAQNANDHHATEHLMINCLSLSLNAAHRQQRMPDEQEYLACLQELTRGAP
jgi:hypothetical protein